MNEENRNNREKNTPFQPPRNGQKPPQSRTNPPPGVQRPPQNSQRPPQSRVNPPRSEQRSVPGARRPISNGRRSAPQKRPPEQPPRRRNEESYVFSRSLSETQERILAERRERLEDARRFRREDVKDKLIKGAIAFGITLVLMVTIAAIIVSVSLNSGQVKKNKGAAASLFFVCY